jgi:hypothetical protein
MRYDLTLAALLLALAPVALAADDKMPMPGWMTGAWTGGTGEAWGDEYWTPPRGDLGTSINLPSFPRKREQVVPTLHNREFHVTYLPPLPRG